MKFYRENVILILDEFSSLCEQMTSTMTMDDMHDVNNQVLREFIKGVSRVICLDADLTNDDVQFVKSQRNDVHVIHNTFKAQDGDQVMMYETEQLLKLKVLDLLQGGKRIWISSTHSAENTEALHQMLQEKGFHGMCVTKNTSEADKRDIVKNINTHMANLNYFIHTPTISVGIDYNVKDHVDYVVGFFNTHSEVNVETCRQMMRRVRHVKSKTYLVHVDRATNNLPTSVQGIRDWIISQYSIVKSEKRGFSGLKLHANYGEGLTLVEDDFYNQLYTFMRIKKNLSLNGFMQRFIQQMVDAGCIIQGVQGHVAKNHPVIKSQKEILERIKEERYQQIAGAENLTHEDFMDLRELPELEPADKYAVSKYLLMKAYDVSTPDVVTPEWVKAYDNEQEKRIYRNLRSLSTTANGTTMEARLETVRQREEASLGFCPKTRVPHNLEDSRYVKLQYAVDIMITCGFTDIFTGDRVPAQTLKGNINRIWDGVMKEMDNTCTTLGRKRPTHNNWTSKNQIGFLNMVLFDVLGVKIVGVNHRSAKYELRHCSKV
ncbi:hypothetical protein BGZ46_005207, partial [Entomortierella lignicola]